MQNIWYYASYFQISLAMLRALGYHDYTDKDWNKFTNISTYTEATYTEIIKVFK